MKDLKTQGFILLDVDVVALNNGGKNNSSMNDNVITTKTIVKNGKCYVYVSGQAWRYWWRNSLQKDFAWKLSPIIRKEKIVFTSTNPIKYPDDDMFGYMKAAKRDKSGKSKKEDIDNITVTRVSPLKNSAIVSVAATRPAENWSSMSRQEGDAVPYSKQEYSAIMKGMFSIDLGMVGTFSNYNRTGYMNLSDKLKQEALENGATEIADEFVANHKLVQLPKATREKRILDTIQALKHISGGAMQTNNMGDVTPKFVVLATTTTGNHPFSHLAKATGAYDDIATLNVDGLREVLKDYKDTFVGKVFIGKRSGFQDDTNDALKAMAEEYKDLVVFGTVNEVIDAYCEQVKNQIN